MLIENSLFTPDFFNLTVHGGEKFIINEKSFSSEFSLCFLQYSLGSMWFNQHKKVLVFKKKKNPHSRNHMKQSCLFYNYNYILFHLNLLNCMGIQNNLSTLCWQSEAVCWAPANGGKWDFGGDSGIWIWGQQFLRVFWETWFWRSQLPIRLVVT